MSHAGRVQRPTGGGGGEGACDRKAAQVKSHVRSLIDESSSVTTPDEFLEAISCLIVALVV